MKIQIVIRQEKNQLYRAEIVSAKPTISAYGTSGSSVSFMKPNTKGLLPDSFKPLQNKGFIVLNAFI